MESEFGQGSIFTLALPIQELNRNQDLQDNRLLNPEQSVIIPKAIISSKSIAEMDY